MHVKDEAEKHVEAAKAYRFSCQGIHNCSSWIDVADHYKRAANVWGRQPLKCPDEAASLYMKAAAAMRKVTFTTTRPTSSIKLLYDRAQAEFLDVAKYDLAGRAEEEKALLEETEGNLLEAAACYVRASNYYMANGMQHVADIVMERAAHTIVCSNERSYYEQAAGIYEQLGRRKLRGNLTKNEACDSFFKMGLLILATGPARCSLLEEKLLELAAMDIIFEKSRQYAFLQHLMNSLGAGALDMFADHLHAYDCVSKLDRFELDLLEITRQDIQNRPKDKNVEK